MTATLTPGDWVRQYYSTDGKIRWAARYIKEDFNDVEAAVMAAGLEPIWQLGQVTITGITAYLRSTTSGAGLTWMIILRFGATSQYVRLKSFVTPASKINVERVDCEIPLADELRNTTNGIVYVSDTTDPAVAHNADDCWLTLEGYVTPRGPTPDVNPSAVPVSIEGYRWPLRRT